MFVVMGDGHVIQTYRFDVVGVGCGYKPFAMLGQNCAFVKQLLFSIRTPCCFGIACLYLGSVQQNCVKSSDVQILTRNRRSQRVRRQRVQPRMYFVCCRDHTGLHLLDGSNFSPTRGLGMVDIHGHARGQGFNGNIFVVSRQHQRTRSKTSGFHGNLVQNLVSCGKQSVGIQFFQHVGMVSGGCAIYIPKQNGQGRLQMVVCKHNAIQSQPVFFVGGKPTVGVVCANEQRKSHAGNRCRRRRLSRRVSHGKQRWNKGQNKTKRYEMKRKKRKEKRKRKRKKEASV